MPKEKEKTRNTVEKLTRGNHIQIWIDARYDRMTWSRLGKNSVETYWVKEKKNLMKILRSKLGFDYFLVWYNIIYNIYINYHFKKKFLIQIKTYIYEKNKSWNKTRVIWYSFASSNWLLINDTLIFDYLTLAWIGWLLHLNPSSSSNLRIFNP